MKKQNKLTLEEFKRQKFFTRYGDKSLNEIIERWYYLEEASETYFREVLAARILKKN